MKNFFSSLKAYKKSITALVTAGIAWANIIVFSPTAEITSAEWLTGAILLAGAAGVYKVTNEPNY